jgi:hypothetical protein
MYFSCLQFQSWLHEWVRKGRASQLHSSSRFWISFIFSEFMRKQRIGSKVCTSTNSMVNDSVPFSNYVVAIALLLTCLGGQASRFACYLPWAGSQTIETGLQVMLPVKRLCWMLNVYPFYWLSRRRNYSSTTVGSLGLGHRQAREIVHTRNKLVSYECWSYFNHDWKTSGGQSCSVP